MLRPEEIDKISYRKFKFTWRIKKSMYISFATIPLVILLFYGIEDKNAWFFGHIYVDDYRHRIGNNVVYNLGLMIGHA
jgi:hypothetical protein